MYVGNFKSLVKALPQYYTYILIINNQPLQSKIYLPDGNSGVATVEIIVGFKVEMVEIVVVEIGMRVVEIEVVKVEEEVEEVGVDVEDVKAEVEVEEVGVEVEVAEFEVEINIVEVGT